jgi:hypothetical protein
MVSAEMIMTMTRNGSAILRGVYFWATQFWKMTFLLQASPLYHLRPKIKSA